MNILQYGTKVKFQANGHINYGTIFNNATDYDNDLIYNVDCGGLIYRVSSEYVEEVKEYDEVYINAPLINDFVFEIVNYVKQGYTQIKETKVASNGNLVCRLKIPEGKENNGNN